MNYEARGLPKVSSLLVLGSLDVAMSKRPQTHLESHLTQPVNLITGLVMFYPKAIDFLFSPRTTTFAVKFRPRICHAEGNGPFLL